MGDTTQIQWCDKTFNPWMGCTKVAPECKNCYAEVIVDKRFDRAHWGKGQPRYRTKDANWKQPLRWNKEAGISGMRPKVFCLSLGDWLDEEVPIEWLMSLLTLIETCQNLDWLLLTKRSQNWKLRLEQITDAETNHVTAPIIARNWLRGVSPQNVWIGVSAGADQRAALDIPAKIHFLSCEPMLKPIDSYSLPTQEFDWIIFGGESGTHARTCDLQWIRDGLTFCRRNEITPFVKQLGAKPCVQSPDGYYHLVLQDSHGGDLDEWPTDLRVREFPA
jgi:protein gp37